MGLHGIVEISYSTQNICKKNFASENAVGGGGGRDNPSLLHKENEQRETLFTKYKFRLNHAGGGFLKVLTVEAKFNKMTVQLSTVR